jgi:hypothetical protein
VSGVALCCTTVPQREGLSANGLLDSAALGEFPTPTTDCQPSAAAALPQAAVGGWFCSVGCCCGICPLFVAAVVDSLLCTGRWSTCAV